MQLYNIEPNIQIEECYSCRGISALIATLSPTEFIADYYYILEMI